MQPRSEPRGAGGIPTREGRVVASHGRHLWVESGDGSRRICHPRGKRNEAVVGDLVRWSPSADEGRIEHIHERRNLLFRQDELRTKAFAANIDQVFILLAARPAFAQGLLARALVAAAAQRIPARIALNKRDLGEEFDAAWAQLADYRGAASPGTDMLALSLRQSNEDDAAALRGALAGHVTLVLGPSGAGKSTLINRLVPAAKAMTGELSQSQLSGRHTTTHTAWYSLDDNAGGALIDSPGFQQFGLHHVPASQLASLMPDLAPHAQKCRFYNCTHRHEPDCGVKLAVSDRQISQDRYQIYCNLYAELAGAD